MEISDHIKDIDHKICLAQIELARQLGIKEGLMMTLSSQQAIVAAPSSAPLRRAVKKRALSLCTPSSQQAIVAAPSSAKEKSHRGYTPRKISELLERVCAHLKAHPKGTLLDDISTELKVDRKQLSNLFFKKRGMFYRPAQGMYCLAEDDPTSPAGGQSQGNES